MTRRDTFHHYSKPDLANKILGRIPSFKVTVHENSWYEVQQESSAIMESLFNGSMAVKKSFLKREKVEVYQNIQELDWKSVDEGPDEWQSQLFERLVKYYIYTYCNSIISNLFCKNFWLNIFSSGIRPRCCCRGGTVPTFILDCLSNIFCSSLLNAPFVELVLQSLYKPRGL